MSELENFGELSRARKAEIALGDALREIADLKRMEQLHLAGLQAAKAHIAVLESDLVNANQRTDKLQAELDGPSAEKTHRLLVKRATTLIASEDYAGAEACTNLAQEIRHSADWNYDE